jgi:hypothetical protein
MSRKRVAAILGTDTSCVAGGKPRSKYYLTSLGSLQATSFTTIKIICESGDGRVRIWLNQEAFNERDVQVVAQNAIAPACGPLHKVQGALPRNLWRSSTRFFCRKHPPQRADNYDAQERCLRVNLLLPKRGIPFLSSTRIGVTVLL